MHCQKKNPNAECTRKEQKFNALPCSLRSMPAKPNDREGTADTTGAKRTHIEVRTRHARILSYMPATTRDLTLQNPRANRTQLPHLIR